MDQIEQRVRETVEASDAEYEFVPCDAALADTVAFCEAYGYSPEDSANCILVATKEDVPRVVACVVLATTRLDVNGVVRRRLGARKISFAPADMTQNVTGMALGGVTPFGLPPDFPVWVDARVMDRERIVLGGGSRTMKVVGSPALLHTVGAEIVDDLAKPAPEAG